MKRVVLLGAWLLCLSSLIHAQTWYPFEMAWNTSPVNLSFLQDPPAGNHGFLGVDQDRFVFEDQTEFRAWGTTVTASGCFPDPEQAPAIAERLYRFGFNLVRFHQLDAVWAEPNLFLHPSQPGKLLNPIALDRLDYFLYQLENRGIYAWMDGLTSRTLQEDDGIVSWKYLPPGLKGYIYFVPEMQQIHQEFLEEFWSHRNRYTGRQYRDSPSIVMTELFHDNNLFLDRARIQPFADQLKRYWQDWQERKQKEQVPFDWDHPTADMQLFLSQVMGTSLTEFYNFLRSLSVKAAITSTNAVTSTRDLGMVSALDFVHAEGLWNAPLLSIEGYTNRRMTDVDPAEESNLFSFLSFSRIPKKPFVVSKWGHPWPSVYRAELPVWMAAMASFQDWNGCISSTYRSFHDPSRTSISAPLELFNDPCLMGLMPAAALLYLRQDVKPARKRVYMAVPEPILPEGEQVTPESCSMTRLAEVVKVATKLGSKPVRSSLFAPTETIDVASYFQHADPSSMLKREVQRGIVLIDSPRTQAMIGHLQKSGPGDLSLLQVVTREDFGVVCVSSMSDQAVNRAKELLVTIISQAQNKGFLAEEADGDVFRMRRRGESPVMIRETPVRLFIQTRHKDWTVRPLRADGSTGQELAYQVENGILSFRAGVHGTIYYRLSCSTRD